MKIEKLADRLRYALKLRGKKQVDLANYLKIDRATAHNYVFGKYAPKQDRIYLLSQWLDVDPAWLMGFDVPMDRVVTERIKDSDNDLLVASIEKLTDEQKELIKSMINQFTKRDK